jgi:hypothetical protein
MGGPCAHVLEASLAMQPNFFVAGTPKAGTTSLYNYLAQHPSIFMSPIKEPCFFAPEVIDFTPESREAYESDREALRDYLDGDTAARRSHGIVIDWNDYLKLFKRADRETAIGEVSGNYLASAGAAGAIRKRIPAARIVIMLRDPVDRLYSQYASALASGYTSTAFVRWALGQAELESRRQPPFGPVWTGFYGKHLRRWFDAFPREQISVHFHDDYARDSTATLRTLFDFLGVEASAPIDTRQRHNVSRVPRFSRLHRLPGRNARRRVAALLPERWRDRARRRYLKPAGGVSADERRRIVEIYQEDIMDLARLLGRDLSSWLAPSRSERPGH